MREVVLEPTSNVLIPRRWYLLIRFDFGHCRLTGVVVDVDPEKRGIKYQRLSVFDMKCTYIALPILGS